ncbi:REP-associated tyrosine transposase [Thioalkalivibrio sp.]|uniref:REP-associated tyrosine transposase n=1 Tax=Thioalkalivibrio sp. TaxID=2093813 RepID=UPI0035621F68
MPRRARHYVAGLPYHLVQRGNNRQDCFLDPADYRRYLELWEETSRRYGVAVHAYCLMTNHVHFLATPAEADSLSNTMKVVGSRFAQYVNRRYQRTGTLWEGRHRASLVQSERYLLTCYRYIELNPVRAGMVASPEDYPWSSHRMNAWGEAGWIQPHSEYVRLDRDASGRLEAYRGLFSESLPSGELAAIRRAIYYCQPVGDNAFRERVERQFGVRFGQMKPGRPWNAGNGQQGKV